MATSEPVLLETDGGVVTITLNRPDRMNAITVAMGAALQRSLREAGAVAKVVVIRGAGGNFCAGGDFRELGRLREAGREAMAEMFDNFRRSCTLLESLPVPVICAVEGYATAGGFELLQAADIVLVHENAVLADIHSKYGQLPGGGGTQRLPRLVGRQRALAHILTADTLSPADAVSWGLAYRVFAAADFNSGVKAFAENLAAKDTATLACIKKLVYDGARLPLDDALILEREAVLDHVAANGTGDRRG